MARTASTNKSSEKKPNATQAVAKTKEPVVSQKVTIPEKVIDNNYVAEVYNNTIGKLVFTSPRTHIEYKWDNYGDMQLMEISELVAMRASQKRFFSNGWIYIEDLDVIKYMRLEKFKQETMSPEELEGFFNSSVDKMKKVLEKSTAGTKSLIASSAFARVESGDLDSAKKIKFLEEYLNLNLQPEID